MEEDNVSLELTVSVANNKLISAQRKKNRQKETAWVLLGRKYKQPVSFAGCVAQQCVQQ